METERARIGNVLCAQHSTAGGRRLAQGRASLPARDACDDVHARTGRHVLLLLRGVESAGAHLHS
ncbi:conserved hypothetical protein [Ricinus communis]|uniref:Uncharacterized protein n=1 Tax=Ricinus communis TaxID=3988 RepID=B9T7G7_RICCO|nr:conserved hypothetical protein [Ricinus communis]